GAGSPRSGRCGTDDRPARGAAAIGAGQHGHADRAARRRTESGARVPRYRARPIRRPAALFSGCRRRRRQPDGAADGAADARREQRQVRRLAPARWRVDPSPRRGRRRSPAAQRRRRRPWLRRGNASRGPRPGPALPPLEDVFRRHVLVDRGVRARANGGLHRSTARGPAQGGHCGAPSPKPHGPRQGLMRVYIVDDEKLAVQRLQRLLEATGRITIAGSSTDPEEALAFLRAHDVDVLFLDIQMPGLTGCELLEQLDRDIAVISTTAYDRYAIEAFTVHSIDYLLK